MSNYFAENLKELRNNLGYTQQEMADLLNIGKARYSSYEEDRAEPSYDVLIDICKFHGITDIYGFITRKLTDKVSVEFKNEKKKLKALMQIKKIVESLHLDN